MVIMGILQAHVHVLDDLSNDTMIHDKYGHTSCTCTCACDNVHVLDDLSNDTVIHDNYGHTQ